MKIKKTKMNSIIKDNKGASISFLARGLCLLAFCLAACFSRADTASQDIHVFYIPQEDLRKAPGYTENGMFLPLSELLSLADMAAKGSDASPESLPVSCASIRLAGNLSNALFLEGILEYNAPSEGWSSTLVEDCLFPWISQEPESDNPAFLARIRGKTCLYVKGPAKGKIALKAVFPLAFDGSRAELSIGPFSAPCRMDLDLEENLEIQPDESLVMQKYPDEKNKCSIFLTTHKAARLLIRRAAPFYAPSGLRVNIDRAVSNVGAGVNVVDTLLLQDSFSPDTVLNFAIPENLRFLRVKNPGAFSVEATSNTLSIKPLENLDAIRLELIFSADMKGTSTRLGTWNIPSLYVESSLTIQSSERYALLPSQLPLSLIPKEGSGNSLRYACWGNLPAISLSLAPRVPSIPPVIHAAFNISRNRADAIYNVSILDKNLVEMQFDIPPDWILADLALKRNNENTPMNLAIKDKTRYRIIWQGGANPDALQFNLRRVGSWGAPGTANEIEIPFVSFEGPRPFDYEMTVAGTEGLNIRPRELKQLSIMTPEPSQMAQQGTVSHADFRFKANGENPGGSLVIEGRDADVRAVAVTTLSLGDDQTMVRALIGYQARIAPARTFRFILPHGTGNDVRINAPEIREKSMKKTSKGEEWTIVTQADILGPYEIRVEWPLESPQKGVPIKAPEIYIPGVNSREGFLILEGSETLQLNIMAKNLSEADLADLPPLPWQSDKRTIAIYRYVEPPFTLEVLADKFQPEPLLKGIVKQAEITSSFTPQGEEFTQAVYTLTPFSERQFFEIQLPEKAKTWSVQVNSQGVKPATRKISGGGDLLLIPLPSASEQVSDISIRILYHRAAQPLSQATGILLVGPLLSAPVNRTIWNLNLPSGFEYLSFDIDSRNKTSLHEPIITYLRKAYYPKKILFPQMSIIPIIVFTVIGIFIFLFLGKIVGFLGRKKPEVPQAPKKTAKPLRKPGCTFTIFEFLVVALIVAILSAIAVPNFLEAQSRSKVSRIRADMRSMATGLEAYYVDNNAYPPNAEILWQGAVKYLSGSFSDPFTDYKGTPLKYVVGRPAIEKAIETGYLPPDYPITDDAGFWLIYSDGPDTRDDGATVVYDPTNGTISVGDVIRVKNGGGPQHYAGYKRVRDEERRDLSTKAISLTDSPQGTPAPPAVAGLITMDRFEGIPQASEKTAPREKAPEKQEVRFQAGIQSLSIEIPSGGIQRTLESLAREPQMKVRFLEERKFLCLRFLSWILPLLFMMGIWIFKRSLFHRFFLIGIILVLLLPLLKSSTWTPFFNSAFLGIVCSLSAPILARLFRRYLNPRSSGTAITLILFGILALNSDVNAEATSQTAHYDGIEFIVPYGPDQVPGTEENPLSFISKEDFTILWKKAWKEPDAPSPMYPIAARITLSGALSPDGTHIHGGVSIYAVNPGDAPASLDLGMNQIRLPSLAENSGKAFLESTPRGLVLQLSPHWMGEIVTPFILPCEGRGLTGRFQIEFPDSAIGFWKFQFPYPRITANAANSAPLVIDQSPEGSSLSGWTKPGVLDVSWKGETEAHASPGADLMKNWRASFDARFEWNSLAFAGFSSVIKIEKKDVSGSIPDKIKLLKDPSLQILSAKGDDLLETRISDTEVELSFNKTGTTEITIQGFQIKPKQITGKDRLVVSWDAAALRAPDGIDSQFSLFFDVSDQIEIASVNTERLERRQSRELRPGFASQQYETVSPDWKAQFVFKPFLPVFDAHIRELWAPLDGFLRRICDVSLTPSNSRIAQCMISLPDELKVLNVSGNQILNWAQDDKTLLIAFQPALEYESTVRIFASSDMGEAKDNLFITPLSVSRSSETRRLSILLYSRDQDLYEIDLAGAVSRALEQKDQELFQSIPLKIDKNSFFLRPYDLSSPKPLNFRLLPVEATALYTAFNQATVSDGLQSLDAVLRVEPRRGRIRKISALLILPSPDPQAPARLRSLGPVRDIVTHPLSDRIFRITADLSAPQSEPVNIRFLLESPVNTENGREIGVSILAPEEGAGARSLLLLRRTFEGELNLKNAAGARIIDPNELRRPEMGLAPLPSDQSFDLSLKAGAAPTFLIARHKREEALRAVVEILRQRTIVTPDGMERCELEIVLQNKSEQFLRIALPYPKKDVSIYEVLVASRPVKTTFARENNRDILMVPLIRTGLLEPELTVSVAYVVHNREPFKGKGTRQQKLPEILGDIPVAQSALILMMPSSYRFYDFSGSLNQVQLLDIEVDEALRQAKQAEKLSQAVLYAKGDKQVKLLDNLAKYKSRASSKIKYVEQTSEAYQRQSGKAGRPAGKAEDKKEQELSVMRGASLQMAQQAEQNIALNYAQATQMAQSQQQAMPVQVQPAPQQAAVIPPRILPAPISFPRTGDVYVFRQLQGTGMVRFKYSSRQSRETKKDLLLLLVIFILICILVYSGSRLFSTRRRVAGLLVLFSLLSIFFGFAIDFAIPLLGVAWILLHTAKKSSNP
ncbi:hypothetical protein JW926_05470 [Candidatus Sumerlaeota bacterium]|nr:hypothetical protein [Candidatus Sumerlaeota bacterium]